MRLSTEQIEKLSERVFLTVYHSNQVQIFPDDELSRQLVKDEIFQVIEQHFKEQQSFFLMAYRELKGSQLAPNEDFGQKQLERAEKIARSRGSTTMEVPELFDELGEKIQRRLWNLECFDAVVSDKKITNLIAKALKRFQRQNDQINELIEELIHQQYPNVRPYSAEWLNYFDEIFDNISEKARQKIAHEESDTENF